MSNTSPLKRRPWIQLRLRWLLLAFVPLAIGLAYYGHVRRQEAATIAAFQAICGKGVDLHYRYQDNRRFAIFFKYSNVTDAELDSFTAAFSAYGQGVGIGPIACLKLNGSPVSDEAIARFERAFPDCKVER
jgi:hypothetical protein